LSSDEKPIASAEHTAKVCRMVERCEYSAAFGLPVVPEV